MEVVAQFGMQVRHVKKNRGTGAGVRARLHRVLNMGIAERLGSTSAAVARSLQFFRSRSTMVASPFTGTASNRTEHGLDAEGTMAIAR